MAQLCIAPKAATEKVHGGHKNNKAVAVELELAVAKLGLILACQNWRQSDTELEYCIQLVSPKLLLHSRRQAEAVGRIDRFLSHYRRRHAA